MRMKRALLAMPTLERYDGVWTPAGATRSPRGWAPEAKAPTRRDADEDLYILALAGDVSGAHRAQPQGARARAGPSQSGGRRPASAGLQSRQPAAGAPLAGPGRRQRAPPVAGDPGVSRRGLP